MNEGSQTDSERRAGRKFLPMLTRIKEVLLS
jgi:hypothetical protein